VKDEDIYATRLRLEHARRILLDPERRQDVDAALATIRSLQRSAANSLAGPEANIQQGQARLRHQEQALQAEKQLFARQKKQFQDPKDSYNRQADVRLQELHYQEDRLRRAIEVARLEGVKMKIERAALAREREQLRIDGIRQLAHISGKERDCSVTVRSARAKVCAAERERDAALAELKVARRAVEDTTAGRAAAVESMTLMAAEEKRTPAEEVASLMQEGDDALGQEQALRVEHQTAQVPLDKLQVKEEPPERAPVLLLQKVDRHL
jgi:hypothetical protein